jgi:HlyD family secretion protein
LKLSKKWLVLLAVVVAVAIFAAFAMRGKDKTQYFTQKVDKGDIREVVEATGTINAVTTVQVGSQVSGTIEKLYVDFNSKVKKGELVAQLDPSLFRSTLMSVQADFENAIANEAVAKANLAKAQAALVQTKADFDRTAGLTKEGVMSQQQLDIAKANYDSAIAAVNAAKAQVGQATAQVSQKRASVAVAQTNLNYTTIHAPVDGTVINRNVDVGQTVAASLQAPTLFTIAQDLTKMQVYVATDESDVGMIRLNQPVTFKVDAFPRDVFRGHVSQIRMNATTVQNVVTYNTIVDFDNPELKLFPGMTAYVTVPVATASDVVKIPNGAIRYKPDMTPQEIRAALSKAGIEAGSAAGGGTRQASAGAPAAPAGQQAAAGQGQGGMRQGGGGGGMRAGGSGVQGGQGGGQAGGARQMGRGGEQPGGGPAREQRTDTAIVWKRLPDGKTLEPVQIKTGITDHTVTEVVQVLKGSLNPGDEVIVGSTSSSGGAAGRPPGMMGGGRPPGR